MRTVSLLALLFLAHGAGAQEPTMGASPAKTDRAAVVATVNGEQIYFEDLERGLGELHSGQSAAARGNFDLDKLMFRIVNDALIAQEARALGMDAEDSIPQKLEKLRDGLAVKRLEYEAISSRAEVSDEEVRRAFEHDYRRATLHIITTYERDEALGVLEALNGGTDFEELAKQRSIDDYAARGGVVRDLARVDIPPELAEVAFDSPPGQIVGPIRTGLGWATIRTDSVADADPERFTALERRVREVVRFRKAEELRAELGRQVRDTRLDLLNYEVVESVGVERVPDGRLMAKFDDPDAVVARLGERTIKAAELGRALQLRWRGVRNEEAALAARPIVLERLLRDQLMLAEALHRGYGETPAVHRAVQAYERQLLVPRFLREVVADGISVDETEARAFYEANLEAFRKPARLHIGQITVESEQEAEEMVTLLEQGADLAWLARQHSIDGLKEAGGDKGWVIPQTNFSALHNALADATTGDVLGPLGAPGRYTVVRVNAREEQGFHSFEEGANRAEAGVSTTKFQRALDEFIMKLRSRSEIDIHEEVLASMSISGRVVEDEATPPGHGH